LGEEPRYEGGDGIDTEESGLKRSGEHDAGSNPDECGSELAGAERESTDERAPAHLLEIKAVARRFSCFTGHSG
jgi:hypothetical protein